MTKAAQYSNNENNIKVIDILQGIVCYFLNNVYRSQRAEEFEKYISNNNFLKN